MLYTLELTEQINNVQLKFQEMYSDGGDLSDKAVLIKEDLRAIATAIDTPQLALDIYHLVRWNQDVCPDRSELEKHIREMANHWEKFDDLFGMSIADTVYQQVLQHLDASTEVRAPVWDEVEFVISVGCNEYFLQLIQDNLDTIANGYAVKLGNAGWAGVMDEVAYDQFFEQHYPSSNVPPELRKVLLDVHTAAKPYYLSLQVES